MAKYNIIISEGCTANYTSINDKIVGGEYEPTRLSKSETAEFTEHLILKLRECLHSGEVRLDDLIEIFPADEYEYDDNICETCGDTVSRKIWNL